MEDQSVEPLHVLDLPQLYQKPTFNELQTSLTLLSTTPTLFGTRVSERTNPRRPVNPEGVPGYLTSIVASSLDWIENDDERDSLWNTASKCLAERSGRSAMGNLCRTFEIPTEKASLTITLQEPSMTEDNLGLKTWSSSLVLAKQLHLMSLPRLSRDKLAKDRPLVLELGAGTGLAGIAAAAIWQTEAILTDLPEIVPNLTENIESNTDVLSWNHGVAVSGVLDWERPTSLQLTNGLSNGSKAMIVLAADPIYSPKHPHIFAETVCTWLCRHEDAIFVLTYSVREAYANQIFQLRSLLHEAGLFLVEEKTIEGWDDSADQLTHSYSTWKWENPLSERAL